MTMNAAIQTCCNDIVHHAKAVIVVITLTELPMTMIISTNIMMNDHHD